MFTIEELNQLTDYLVVAFKDIFATKEDISDLKDSFNSLQMSVDGIARNHLKMDQESIIQTYRMQQAENWIDKAAPKIGIEFGH